MLVLYNFLWFSVFVLSVWLEGPPTVGPIRRWPWQQRRFIRTTSGPRRSRCTETACDLRWSTHSCHETPLKLVLSCFHFLFLLSLWPLKPHTLNQHGDVFTSLHAVILVLHFTPPSAQSFCRRETLPCPNKGCKQHIRYCCSFTHYPQCFAEQ